MNDKQEMKKLVTCILVGVISFWAINNLSFIGTIFGKIFNVLLPVIVGGALAFILNIPMTRIEKLFTKKIKNKKYKTVIRIVSIILSLLTLVIIITFVAFLLVPELVENIKTLIDGIPAIMNNIEKTVLNLLAKYPDIQIEIAKIFEKTADTGTVVGNILNYIVNGAIGFVSSLISGIATIFTAIVFAVYILAQKEYLLMGIKKLIYAYVDNKRADKIMEIGALTNKTFTNFISGQCLEAVILGAILFIALIVLRLPYALLIAVLTAVTALIPIFGAFIAAGIGAILIAITSPIQALIFIIIFLVVQQIEGNFIYPKVVGKSVGLSPLWTLLAITLGGSLYGIIGMLIGLPVASILYSLLRSDVIKRTTK